MYQILQEYIINETVKERLGGFHSARLLLYSVDFDVIEKCQAAGDWEATAGILSDVAGRLEAAGADFLVLCTNTMHKVAPRIQARAGIPLVHIAEATADALKARGITKAALLGTKYTMTQDFYTSKLAGAGINALIPNAEDVETVNGVIYNELCLGTVSGQSRTAFLRIIDGLAAQGAQGVILGCTEIGLLIRQEDTALPVFDTTLIHAEKAAMLAMEDMTA